MNEADDRLTSKPGNLSGEDRAFIHRCRRRARWRQIGLWGGSLLLLLLTLGPVGWMYREGVTVRSAGPLVLAWLHLLQIPEPNMVLIEGGTYDPGGGDGSAPEGHPVHSVTVPSFAMGRFEVTFEEYDTFVQATGYQAGLPADGHWGRGHRPVINVSWEDATAYARWLSLVTGKRYRLPTESEWEYAARSRGQNDAWSGTSDVQQLAEYAVYNTGRTEAIGSRQPNALGLHDLSGNVLEWTQDCWYESDPHVASDGRLWSEDNRGACSRRVIRGGAWFYDPVHLRVSFRSWDHAGNRNNDVGFRLVQDLEP